MAQHLAPVGETLLDLVQHRVGLVLVGLDGQHGVVAVGIELLALAVEPLEPLLLQQVVDLLVYKLDALVEGLHGFALVGVVPGRLQGPVEVVKHRQQLGDQVPVGLGLLLQVLLGHPLAEIVQLGHGPEVLVEVLVGQLLLEIRPAQQFFKPLSQFWIQRRPAFVLCHDCS